jgi:hypothetical protein
MPLQLYPICWRGRTDCEPLHCIDAAPETATQEQLETLEYLPLSFICSGCIQPDSRTIEQDAYRLCFKNATTDEMSDNDVQDLTHIMAVVSHTLAVDSTRRINTGYIEVPTHQSKT